MLNEPKHYIYYGGWYSYQDQEWQPNYNNAKITTDRAEWLSMPETQREECLMFTRPIFAFGVILELAWILLVTTVMAEKLLGISVEEKRC